MKNLFRLYLSGMFVLTTLSVTAQINVQFAPSRSGQNLQGLSLTQVVNASVYPASIALTIRIKEINSGEVVVIKTPGFILTSGVNSVDRVAFSNATFTFSNTYFGQAVKQTGNFPEGEYEYCFEIEVLETKDLRMLPSYEQCFNHQLQPLTPMLLILPVDGDEICNKRPTFTWQPPMPLSNDARFRLVLAELKEKQDPIEAITFNTPVINQADVRINNLTFPMNRPDLKDGIRYAWQVTVYSNQTILKKSEIWEFTIQCSDQALEPVTESFRELKDLEDGNYYIAKNFLRFSLHNPYGAGQLSYSIESLSEPGLTVKKLPKLALNPGLNKYNIDLTDINDLKEEKEYLLRVYLQNNRQLKLRFIYKNERR